MKTTKRKVLSIFLTLMLLLTMLAPLASISVSADTPSAVDDQFLVDGIWYQILELPTVGTGGAVTPGKVEVKGPEDDFPENTDLVLPKTVTNEKGEEYQLTRINSRAFAEQLGLRSVDMSATVIDTISNGAFADCANLTRVEFPMMATIKLIGQLAFSGCNLTSVYLETYVLNEIGRWAFADNANLKYATIVGRMETNGFVNTEVFLDADENFKLYTDDDVVKEKFQSQVTVESATVIYDSTARFRESGVISGTEFVYNGKPIAPPKVTICYETVTDGVVSISGLNENSGYQLSYKRDGRITEDFTSVGMITVIASVDPTANANNYVGNLTFEVIILPAPLTVIARDQSVADGQSVEGKAEDVICYGLVEGDSLDAVTLSASGNELIPSDAVIRNADGVDVSANYTVTYASGRAFADMDKSVTGVTKGADGNYTLTFGDGSTFLLEIPKASAPAASDSAADGGEADAEEKGSDVLTYVSLGVGGAALAVGVVSIVLGLGKKKKPGAPAPEPEPSKENEEGS